LTNGISQESNEICIPEEQAQALFTNAQLYTECEKELLLVLDLTKELELQIENYDSLGILYEQQISDQDLIIQELQPTSNLLEKILYFISGLVVIETIHKLGD